MIVFNLFFKFILFITFLFCLATFIESFILKKNRNKKQFVILGVALLSGLILFLNTFYFTKIRDEIKDMMSKDYYYVLNNSELNTLREIHNPYPISNHFYKYNYRHYEFLCRLEHLFLFMNNAKEKTKECFKNLHINEFNNFIKHVNNYKYKLFIEKTTLSPLIFKVKDIDFYNEIEKKLDRIDIVGLRDDGYFWCREYNSKLRRTNEDRFGNNFCLKFNSQELKNKQDLEEFLNYLSTNNEVN